MPPILIVLGGATLVGVAAAVLDWRSRRRLVEGLCAFCATPLAETTYHLEGKTICAECADRMRVRLRIALGAWLILFLGLAVLIVWGTIALLVQGDPTWWSLPILTTIIAAVLYYLLRGVIRSMKQQNEAAALLRAINLLSAKDDPPRPGHGA